MIVKAWNNGSHHRDGSRYGFKVSAADRDAFFKPEWELIVLEIEGEAEPVKVELDREGLWGKECREIRCDAVGRWLHKNGMAPWSKINAPMFEIDPLEDNNFVLRKTHKSAKGPHSRPF
jgi:hypothetical protein